MADCPNCNAVLVDRTVTCPACGVVLQPKAATLTSAITTAETRARAVRSPFSAAIVVALLLVSGVAWVIYTMISQSREMSGVLTADCRLKQFGLATYNFQDRYGHLPPRNLPTLSGTMPSSAEADQVAQSFFTELLPFIDHVALHQQIDYGLPWRNPANKDAFSTIVAHYQHPSIAVSPRNEEGYALAHYATNSKVICDTKTARIAEIDDGTSNTVLLGTVNAGFKPWADPTNYRDPSKGFGGGPEAFGTPNRNGIIQLLRVDGSVLRIRATLPLDICERLGDPRDGKAIPDVR
ncbi:MAG TPA: DUF1559 domain-containing protein [Planctomycetaceae bacterium]|nr:DUF1559 domain-containing protein [Planctomycetaceae bacterium]